VITVVVCVPPHAEPLPEALDALGGQAVVVRAGTLWQARQRALTECVDDVLAFVDGDVVVAPDWRERLEAQWSAAPPEIAAIGGPVRMRGDAESPEVAATLDLGGESLDLDPLEHTLIAANLSIRRAPLLGVGGFPPTVDRVDGRDWFAEEHEAQRQLGHWGWLVRYDPALVAERLPGWDGAPRERRFRYGMRLRIGRNRMPGVAAAAMARAAAGAVVAAGMGRRQALRTRAARAAENSGVLLAPLLEFGAWRRRGAWVADARPAARHKGAPPPLILLYHRIAEADADPLGLCVSPANFAEQIELVRDRVVPVDDIAAGSAPSGSVAITFDDGYADNLEPLRSIGLPVTLFAATGHIASGRRFFWDEGARLMLGPGPRPTRLRLAIDGRRFEARMRTPEDREAVFRHLHGLIQPKSRSVIDAVLTQLADWAAWPDEPPETTRLMTPAELTSLAEAGVTIGAHTRDHLNLAHQSSEVVAGEVTGSRDDVAAWTGQQPRGFSYPFGIPRHDVGPIARAAVVSAGFAYAVVNQPVAVMPRADPYALPRLFAPNLPGAEFAAWLASAS
jgi:peptidoglycan/xylan/chitin deacetylase (PgdA/CDA1 family)